MPPGIYPVLKNMNILSGKGIQVLKTNSPAKRILSVSLVLLLCFGHAASARVTLNDIANHWARDNIQRLVDLGITTGYPGGLFKPQNTLTRAEFVTFIMRAIGETGPVTPSRNTFGDTADHWAKKFIEKAVDLGVVVKTEYANNRFLPDQSITREDIAAMVIRALATKSTVKYEDYAKLTFGDKAKISANRRQFVATCVSLGIITGYADNTFKPLQTATRAEAATMLVRLLNVIGGKTTVTAWKHPSDYYSLELESQWNIKPVKFSDIQPGIQSGTVMGVTMNSGQNAIRMIHYPGNNLIEDWITQVLHNYCSAQQLNINWKTENIAGQKTYISTAAGQGQSGIISLTKRGDFYFVTQIYKEGSGDTAEFKKILESVLTALKSSKTLGSDYTGGNAHLLGTWSAGSSETYGSSGTRGFDTHITWTFYQDGTWEYKEMSDIYFSGAGDYGGATDTIRDVGYYRVLGDVIYLYNDNMAVPLPLAFDPGVLVINNQQFRK